MNSDVLGNEKIDGLANTGTWYELIRICSLQPCALSIVRVALLPSSQKSKSKKELLHLVVLAQIVSKAPHKVLLMHTPMERARTSPPSRRGDCFERKPNLRPGSFSFSEPRRRRQSHQPLLRRPPSLSTVYAGNQYNGKIDYTRKTVSNDRPQPPSIMHSFDKRDNRSVRENSSSSSMSSTRETPQAPQNRDRYVHPMLVGRFIPACVVQQDKMESLTPQSTPDLSEIYSHSSSGSSQKLTEESLFTSSTSTGDFETVKQAQGSIDIFAKEQNDTCLTAKQKPKCEEVTCFVKVPLPPTAKDESSNSFAEEATTTGIKTGPEAAENSENLRVHSEKALVNPNDDGVDKKYDCETKVEFQTNCDIQPPSKKRKTIAPHDECKNHFDVKVGCRVAVFWGGENAYFEGTVTRERRNYKRRYFIEYDDGDREWIDFTKHKFYLVEQQPNCAQEEHLSKRNCKPSGSVSPMSDAERKDHKTKPIPRAIDCPSCRTEDPKDAQSGNDWVYTYNIPKVKAEPNSSDDSETDEDEIMEWAVKMFGIRPPIARPKIQSKDAARRILELHSPPSIQDDRVYGGISEAVKRRRSCAVSTTNVQEVMQKTESELVHRDRPRPTHRVKIRNSALMANPVIEPEKDEEIEAKRKKELARALTAEEIRLILGEDECVGPCSTNWVRRSVRQPSKHALNSPRVKDLIAKLKSNDPDMVVLKMKKYVNDPNTPCLVIDAVLAALEENTNCEALYIQNFNEGMRDEQMMSLLQVLQRSSCNIWCLNIGETYKVKQKTWKRFAIGLKKTKITHMYASEHVISTELKDQIRSTIRDNRSKHSMHCDPNNLDTIVKCTHCWWNPVNTKSLRPYLKKRGYDRILGDSEFQGLPGSSSGATLI
ncbi:hypothetical protein FisN_5Lh220 [Fistulifera solaris]|uniref:Tudor domain-containing protein n=1 Tax=Fistulifera solaris TaxID=1519565 RepID=A0A1Z5JIQ5_FISSO|nr:hypothetical protein FisN_5Lh220 [Fistulifera solaris]|eukprot:GAX13884.1 hypothetical protein FisN_5Lh220 [Fistulifera solaris]